MSSINIDKFNSLEKFRNMLRSFSAPKVSWRQRSNTISALYERMKTMEMC